ncbi:SRPBCC family protein [Streptomyces cellulosae]|uniref:SRPBCC family protein n=1 Tax=Streptomyces thermocarboxydus TaxID=59299 RepID=A0ABU3JDC2_9ACTN|nr:SRPBCC family protein [Streptomyces thermocarboxydus]
MELRHEFTVPVPVDDAWRALLDIERVAPCLPGATVEEFDDKTVTGSVRVKVGPVTVTYKGTAVFEERDEQARRVVLVAGGRDARGQGTARATVTGTLSERDGVTAVTVLTDLTVTGRPAQFGRGVLSEVGERIIGRFAACLAERLRERADETPEEPTAADEKAGAEVTAPEPAAQEPLDLLRSAGLPVAARAAAALAAVVAVAVSVLGIRRRRNARKKNAAGGV